MQDDGGTRCGGAARRMRTDAARNREKILTAARELFLAHGTGVPLDLVARHAGVSIATVYRRFPDRTSLVAAVAVEEASTVCDLLDATAKAVADGGGREVWEGFVLRALDAPSHLGALFAAGCSDLLAGDRDIDAIRRRVQVAMDGLLTVARDHGLVRAELDPAEIVVYLTAATRPLPHLALSEETTAHLVHRMVQVVLAGMRPDRDRRVDGQRPDLDGLLTGPAGRRPGTGPQSSSPAGGAAPSPSR